MATAARRSWIPVYLAAAIVLGLVLGALLFVTPRKDGAMDWTAPMIPGGWMAWTFPTALFFFAIGSVLVLFTLLAMRFPETPRVGVLRIETTRGDRLFITLLGSAFICLAWLGLVPLGMWWALLVCLLWALAVFRWV